MSTQQFVNRIGAVFDSTHREFAGWYPRLWRPLGEIAVSVGRPEPGQRVFDACCGSGASAIPAARAVGPGGSVDAVDLSGELLEQGRAEARGLGLSQLRFHHADVLGWPGVEGGYDLVQCVYGIFFLPDLDAGLRGLVAQLRPGGRLVASTWLRGGMDRLVPIARAAAVAERPDLATPERRAHTEVDTVDGLTAQLSAAGLREVSVHEVRYVQPLHPDDAWSFFLGAALRNFVSDVDEAGLLRVRERFLAGMAEAGIDTLDATTLIGTGLR